jgi:hypothetical protein
MDWTYLSQDIGITGAGCCECGDKFSGFVECRKFLIAEDQLAIEERLCSMEFIYLLFIYLFIYLLIHSFS